MKTLSNRLKRFSSIDIYPVISSEFCNNRPVLDVLKAIADGGARIVQLREKNITKRALYKLAEAYRAITDQYNMLLIINDHLDIALSTGADGSHLGQDDFPIDAAKKLAPDLIIGSSTHSKQEALDSFESGADYINIGPIYSTQTKKLKESVTGIGIESISRISPLTPLPFTVMGGIKERHLPDLIAHGATRIAMVTEITLAEDITQKVRQLRTYFPQNR